MSIGNGGVNIGSTIPEYVYFFWKGNKVIDFDTDLERYRFYRDNVLISFVEQSRENFDSWVVGTAIPEKLLTVSWCNGNIA